MIAFRTLGVAPGTVKVVGSGHSLVTFDGRHVPAPAGSIRESIARIQLLKPLDANPGNRVDAFQIGRLLAPTVEPVNVVSAFLLASAVEFVPAPAADRLHEVRLLVDGLEKAKVTV